MLPPTANAPLSDSELLLRGSVANGVGSSDNLPFKSSQVLTSRKSQEQNRGRHYGRQVEVKATDHCCMRMSARLTPTTAANTTI